MRKILLAILPLLFLSMGVVAQEGATNTGTKSVRNYKRSAIEADFGLLRPSTGDGLDDFSPFNVNLGYRYNFTKTIGLKVAYEYGSFDLVPNMTYHNVSLLVPVNLSSLTNLDHYWKGINFFAEIGGGIQSQNPDGDNYDSDALGVTRLNLKASIKLSNSFALNLSMMNSFLAYKENYSFSGDNVVHGSSSITNLRNSMYNSLNIGLSYYFGKKEKHIDWAPSETYLLIEDYFAGANNNDNEALVGLGGRVSKNEGAISDYAGDIQDLKNTINDLKGQLNEIASRQTPAAVTPSNNFNYVSTLVVPFTMNSVNPTAEGLASIVTLSNYLKDNEEASILIKGHADVTGAEGYNQTISEKRALVVKGLLEELGISGSRLEAKGYGESDSLINSKGTTANNINRRVDFELK
ncbi:MAG: OmpA family protein [Bacteroidales bacterium]